MLAALGAGGDGVIWIPSDIAEPGAEADLAPVRQEAVRSARAVIDAARGGRAAAALAALAGFRVLCAHRRGDHGVATWMQRIERWVVEEIDGFAAEGEWYPGRPLLVTENDYALRLYNGDTGVVVAGPDGRPTAAFERRGEIVEIRPSRLSAVDTVYAMTVHKSQGSQFATAAVLLPAPDSRILTRELLYTAPRAALHGRHAGARAAGAGGKLRRRCGPRWSGRSRGRVGCGDGCGGERPYVRLEFARSGGPAQLATYHAVVAYWLKGQGRAPIRCLTTGLGHAFCGVQPTFRVARAATGAAALSFGRSDRGMCSETGRLVSLRSPMSPPILSRLIFSAGPGRSTSTSSRPYAPQVGAEASPDPRRQ